jgi:hypothetical protein
MRRPSSKDQEIERLKNTIAEKRSFYRMDRKFNVPQATIARRRGLSQAGKD